MGCVSRKRENNVEVKTSLGGENVKEIIKKNLYEKFDEDFDEILYFLEGVDSHISADSYGSYFYDGNFIGNDTANGLREIIDNMFEYIKDEDLELIAKELNINE